MDDARLKKIGETRALAEFALNLKLDDCPPDVIHQAKRCTIETPACALGGSRTPLVRTALNAMERMGDVHANGIATIVGAGKRAAPDRAAFVNGVAANALDYDGGVVLQGHYGGTVIFATLAMAELTKCSGREFVEAVIAAYEVTTRIGEATRPTPEYRRQVSGYGPHQGFAAVVAAGRLLKLDVDRMVHAFGIYGTFAPLPSSAQWNWRNRPLTWTKDMVAWPSVSGINAALLAESGFLGPRTILEGDRGFWRMQASDRFDPAMLLEGLGTKFNMLRLYFKAYPTCRWNQAALDAVLQIMARRGWSERDVAAVEVGVARALVDQQFEDYAPHNLVDAQFSLPYAIAVVMHGEKAGPHWYEPALFDSPKIHATMKKVPWCSIRRSSGCSSSGVWRARTSGDRRRRLGRDRTRRSCARRCGESVDRRRAEREISRGRRRSHSTVMRPRSCSPRCGSSSVSSTPRKLLRCTAKPYASSMRTT